MKQKSRRFCKGAACVLAVLMLLLGIYFFVRMGYGYYRELNFYSPSGSEAETLVRTYAHEHGIPFSAWPESLIQLLERNPETETFVLEYPEKKDQTFTVDLSDYLNSAAVPLFLQWDQRWGYIPYGSNVAGLTGCGPVCLSMVAFYLTGDENMSPDKMLAFAEENGYCVPGNGTSWSLISEGAVTLGFDVTEIPLVKSRIFDNLEVGNPIICAMGPGDFTTTGHYIVLTGVQEGLLRINDPNSLENSQKLWRFEDIQDQFRNLWVIRL